MSSTGYDRRMLLLRSYIRLSQTYKHLNALLIEQNFMVRASKIRKLMAISDRKRHKVGMDSDLNYNKNIDVEYCRAQNDIGSALQEINKHKQGDTK